jgi:Tol biopolymer transport system component
MTDHHWIGAAALAMATACAPAAPNVKTGAAADPAARYETPALHLTLLKPKALGCEWDPVGTGRIAYDIKGKDGYYDVWMMDRDGKNDHCLTCDHPALPNRHIGAAFWHPRGKYLLFVAEKKKHPRGSFEAIPGFGGWSDLWVMTPDAEKVFRLTDTPLTPNDGVLPARFSPDGKRIAWTQRERQPNFLSGKRLAGFWSIKVADFVDGPDGPRLANIKTFKPGGDAFYEAYGFSPDGQRLLFCSSFNQKSFWTQQIFTIDAATGGDVRQLTQENYNEHATYTPDGRHVVWMSNRDNRNKGTDWWIMNADGSDPRRLTFMNKPKHPHSTGKTKWAGFPSISPDGKQLVGGVQRSLISQEGDIYLLDLPADLDRG